MDVLLLLEFLAEMTGEDVLAAGEEVVSEATRTMAAFFAVLALANCFFGFKLLKLYMGICGFIFGFFGGVSVALATMFSGDLEPSVGVLVLCGILSGMAGVFLAYKIYVFGLFVTGGGLAFLVVFFLLLPRESYFNSDDTVSSVLPFAIMAFIVVGILTVIIARLLVIWCTGISGGMAASSSLLLIFGVDDKAISIFGGAILSLLGIVFQFYTNKPKPDATKSTPIEKETIPQGTSEQNPVEIPETPICPNCGNPRLVHDKFCGNCGAMFSKTDVRNDEIIP
jgi:hypothetical protein